MKRVVVRDQYDEDGQSVVLLRDGRVLALTTVPSALMNLLVDGPRDVAELTTDLVAEFGVPADGTPPVEVVHRFLRELAEAGLVVPA